MSIGFWRLPRSYAWRCHHRGSRETVLFIRETAHHLIRETALRRMMGAIGHIANIIHVDINMGGLAIFLVTTSHVSRQGTSRDVREPHQDRHETPTHPPFTWRFFHCPVPVSVILSRSEESGCDPTRDSSPFASLRAKGSCGSE